MKYEFVNKRLKKYLFYLSFLVIYFCFISFNALAIKWDEYNEYFKTDKTEEVYENPEKDLNRSILSTLLLCFVFVIIFIRKKSKRISIQENHLCSNCGSEKYNDICPHCGLNPPQSFLVKIKIVLEKTGKKYSGGFGEGFDAIYFHDKIWKGNAFLKRIRFASDRDNLKDYNILLEQNIEIFKWEYSILKKLNNFTFVPQILPYEGLSNIQKDELGNSWCWYLMTKASGIPFSSNELYWKNVKLEIKKKIMVNLCAALIKLHEANIAHRDLKPKNIFFDTTTGFITIIDFGSARCSDEEEVDQHPLADQNVSSSMWCAPEQEDSKLGKINKYSDIWTYGKLFEFIFKNDSNTLTDEISQKLKSRLMSPVPSMRKGALEEFLKLLQKTWEMKADV